MTGSSSDLLPPLLLQEEHLLPLLFIVLLAPVGLGSVDPSSPDSLET